MADRRLDSRWDSPQDVDLGLLVDIHDADMELAESREKDHITATLKDASTQGVKVQLYEPLTLGHHVDVVLNEPSKGERIKLDGDVVWCLELDHTPTYSAGIKLSESGSRDYQKWCQHFNK